MKVLITGSAGFIGSALCAKLREKHRVMGVDSRKVSGDASVQACADLGDYPQVEKICLDFAPDAVVHCAGIAHQRIGTVDRDTYLKINCHAAGHLAEASAQANPEVRFIFLSTVSVYGEWMNGTPVSEDEPRLDPTSDYAQSKLAAEHKLREIFQSGRIRTLDMLRLAPVYDRDWTLNLDRRVFGPGHGFYARFGSGLQRMSALARPNLIDFVSHLIDLEEPERKAWVCNVCDPEPYDFGQIVEVFSRSGRFPRRPTFPVPLSVVWLGSRAGGALFPKNRIWFHACYDKLAHDLTYDVRRMLSTGFTPRHSLQSVFSPVAG
jgi:nucleoside-diphosphate-sugar epimerase